MIGMGAGSLLDRFRLIRISFNANRVLSSLELGTTCGPKNVTGQTSLPTLQAQWLSTEHVNYTLAVFLSPPCTVSRQTLHALRQEQKRERRHGTGTEHVLCQDCVY
eukprot:4747562-Amphidinium_carterae.1